MGISRGSDTVRHINTFTENGFGDLKDKISDFRDVLKELIIKDVRLWNICLLVVVVGQCIRNSKGVYCYKQHKTMTQ